MRFHEGPVGTPISWGSSGLHLKRGATKYHDILVASMQAGSRTRPILLMHLIREIVLWVLKTGSDFLCACCPRLQGQVIIPQVMIGMLPNGQTDRISCCGDIEFSRLSIASTSFPFFLFENQMYPVAT